MANLLKRLGDTGNMVTGLAGLFAVSAGISYYLSGTADELPRFLQYALGTVIGAGILVYWLMISASTKQDKKVARVSKSEIVGKH